MISNEPFGVIFQENLSNNPVSGLPRCVSSLSIKESAKPNIQILCEFQTEIELDFSGKVKCELWTELKLCTLSLDLTLNAFIYSGEGPFQHLVKY